MKRVLTRLLIALVAIPTTLVAWIYGAGLWLLSERLREPIPGGTRFEVTTAFRARILTHWEAPFTGGATRVLPAGCELVSTDDGAEKGDRSCLFVPHDPDSFLRDFIPDEVGRDGFAGVSLPLSARAIRRHLRVRGPSSGQRL